MIDLPQTSEIRNIIKDYLLVNAQPNKKLFVNAAGDGIEFDTGIYEGYFTIDTSLASGSQNITSVPFKPSHGKFIALIDGTLQASWGLDDGTNHKCNFYDSAGPTFNVGNIYSIVLSSGATSHAGYISAWLSNGFTYTWVKTGAKTGTATIFYQVFR